MHIAIVAPSPVPFAIGGAEQLWGGLLDHLNQDTPHQAELIKLPSPERTFAEVVTSYQRFAALDLSHFDLIISGKYPAWMVSHPRHLCYLLHPLRGLYDAYHWAGQPETCVMAHPAIAELQAFMAGQAGVRAALPELFARLHALQATPDVPAAAFRFPGPLIREVVHFLDGIGLAPGAIHRYCAISATVAARPGYFPPGVPVTVIHPPTRLTGLGDTSGDYLFTASRLDAPKRIDLLIEAVRQAPAALPFKIAGTGPDAERLRALAAADSRIELLGFVTDRELAQLYARALAVLFVPQDEDYGLITVEAMQSGKPVITTTDAGGPTELIRDGVNGLIAPPEPAALARCIETLCRDPALARQLGAAARHDAATITWATTISRLLDEPSGNGRLRPRLTVAVTFPVFPPRGGGQSRVFHLYRSLARYADIDLVTLAPAMEPAVTLDLAPGLREIRIPKSAAHEAAEAELARQVGGAPVTDVALPRLYPLTPAYGAALARSAATAMAVIACHPYPLPVIRAVYNGPLWYEAQDVETHLKRSILPDHPAGRELLQLTETVERDCCQRSELIMVCCAADGLTLQQQFAADPGKIVEVANGVDLDTVSYVPPSARRNAQRRLGLDGAFIALFMGSWHGPNLEAVAAINAFAPQLPDVRFLILGSVCDALAGLPRSDNVGFMGVVDDPTRDLALGIAHLALNPMQTGSGTNLKMLDYGAAGLPVLTTPHGVRGLPFRDNDHLWIAELADFPAAIRAAIGRYEDLAALDALAARTRQRVVADFAWPAIADRLAARVFAGG